MRYSTPKPNLCNTEKYQHHEARTDTRAGHYQPCIYRILCHSFVQPVLNC